MSVLEGYADKLERRAGPRFAPGEDGACLHIADLCTRSFQTDSEPGNIDDLYEELESSGQAAGVINRTTANEAGWLARYIRERSLRGREAISEEIEQELQVGCP